MQVQVSEGSGFAGPSAGPGGIGGPLSFFSARASSYNRWDSASPIRAQARHPALPVDGRGVGALGAKRAGPHIESVGGIGGHLPFFAARASSYNWLAPGESRLCAWSPALVAIYCRVGYSAHVLIGDR